MRKSDIIAKARACGCLLLNSPDKLEIHAPIGKVFCFNGHHSISYYTSDWVRAQLYEEIAHDMRGGLIDCPDHHSINPKCETCEEATENGTYHPEHIANFEIWSNPDAQS